MTFDAAAVLSRRPKQRNRQDEMRDLRRLYREIQAREEAHPAARYRQTENGDTDATFMPDLPDTSVLRQVMPGLGYRADVSDTGGITASTWPAAPRSDAPRTLTDVEPADDETDFETPGARLARGFRFNPPRTGGAPAQRPPSQLRPETAPAPVQPAPVPRSPEVPQPRPFIPRPPSPWRPDPVQPSPGDDEYDSDPSEIAAIPRPPQSMMDVARRSHVLREAPPATMSMAGEPFLVGSDTALDKTLTTADVLDPNARRWAYATYTRTNEDTDQVYSGRTSGFIPVTALREGAADATNEAVRQEFERRAAGRERAERWLGERGMARDHQLKTEQRFGPLVLDRATTDQDRGYSMTRGREQQLIDHHGGSQSTWGHGPDGRWAQGTSANKYRGVGDWNRNRPEYVGDSIHAWGNLPETAPYRDRNWSQWELVNGMQRR